MTTEDATYSFANGFEQLYIALRQKEGRIYKDEEVATLPFIDPAHPKYEEWKIRAGSFKRLLRYIKQKTTVINILEVGCGNGWLAAQLANAIPANVTGIDINNTELQQAQRVFSKQSNLDFISGDLRTGILSEKKYDVIVFAASIQYFSPLKEILDIALNLLNKEGEIHMLDSNFYMQDELMAARERTKDYYESLGFPQLSYHYYHHSFETLKQYNYSILRDPHAWKNKLSAVKNPFYWIMIKNNN